MRQSFGLPHGAWLTGGQSTQPICYLERKRRRRSWNVVAGSCTRCTSSSNGQLRIFNRPPTFVVRRFGRGVAQHHHHVLCCSTSLVCFSPRRGEPFNDSKAGRARGEGTRSTHSVGCPDAQNRRSLISTTIRRGAAERCHRQTRKPKVNHGLFGPRYFRRGSWAGPGFRSVQLGVGVGKASDLASTSSA